MVNKVTDSDSPMWAFMRRFDVIHDGELYLRRWRLFECPWFGFYLHKIYRPDRDRDLHDHPWPFISFVLSGRYDEEVPSNNPKYKTWVKLVEWFNKKRATDSHRVHEVYGGVWTFVIRGPRCRVWGFHTNDGWKPWYTYLENK